MGSCYIFDEVLSFICEGDVLMVMKFDCFVCLIWDLMEIVDIIWEKGVEFCIFLMDLDIFLVMGKLMLGIFGLVVEFECEIMLER